MLVVGTVATFFSAQPLGPWVPGSLLAGLDNFLLPLAVMLIIRTFDADSVEFTLRRATLVLLLGMSANAILSVLQSQGVMASYLRPFWSSSASASTVAERAETMGRFSGLFNQPAEAGLAYSLALILGVWYLSGTQRRIWCMCLLLLLLVGGVLTVSKVFVFLGVPLALVYVIIGKDLSTRTRILISTSLTISVLIVSSLNVAANWAGFEYFARLFRGPDSDVLSFYTAGRWNSGSGMLSVVQWVLGDSPFIGYGWAGISVAYDSAWTEIIVVSGLLGLGCLVVVLALLTSMALRNQNQSTRVLMILVVSLTIGATFGLPALTANRVATWIWVIIGLLVEAAVIRPQLEPEQFES
ncbi:MAG: hypothetical protein VB040_11355 [Propionibacterium sp.]|nr:hypothetical protein [Propionibacterium sp.]